MIVFTNHVETKKHFVVRYFSRTFGFPNVGHGFCSRFVFLSHCFQPVGHTFL